MPWVCAPRTSKVDGSWAVYAAACRASRPTCGPLPCDSTSSWSAATLPRAGAALRTLRRCTSVVIGSPRCRSAFPPSATTTRTTTASGSEGGDHDRLDRVQAVLGLVEDDGVLGLEHV